MNLSALHRAQRSMTAERISAHKGSSHRACHRFSKESVAWLQSHANEFTAQEATEYLGHQLDSVRNKARSLGVTFKPRQ